MIEVNRNDFVFIAKIKKGCKSKSESCFRKLFQIKKIALLISNQSISSLPNTADRFTVLLASFDQIINP
jgi:hypothetical protein